MALDVLAQHAIDARLVPLIGSRLALEPGRDIGIEPEGQLLLDGPIEEAAPDESRSSRACEVSISSSRRVVRDFNSARCSRVSRLEAAFFICLPFACGRLAGADDAADRLALVGLFRPSMNHKQQRRPDKPNGVPPITVLFVLRFPV
jgi:hypothetical protein